MKQLTLSRLVTLITFTALFAMAVRTPADTDMYWHLRTGQYILETRTIPHTDPFSSTMLGQPWVDVHWLAQVLLYLIYALSDTTGLALLVAALVVVAFIFVWKQLEGGVFLRAFVVILAAATSGVVWTPRSQMATFVLAAAVSYLLYLYKWRQIDRLWLLPLVFVLWVNLHGGYIAGFIILGAYLGGEFIHNLLVRSGWIARADRPEWIGGKRWRKLLVVTLISGLALLINPYTVDALLLPFKTVNIGALQNFIEEWASPDFHALYQQPMLWMLLLMLCLIGWSGRRLDVTDAALLVIFAYISFVARRNIGLFALIGAPILARYAAAMWAKSPWGTRHLSRGSPILNWVVLIVVGLAAALKIVYPLQPNVQAKAQRDILPIAAADWIAEHRPAGQMFNSYNWGGYLLWRLWPEYPVFVDGRTDVYGAFLREYTQAIFVQPGFEDVFDQYDIGFVVIEKDSPLATALAQSGRWSLAYSDEQAVIFTRVARIL